MKVETLEENFPLGIIDHVKVRYVGPNYEKDLVKRRFPRYFTAKRLPSLARTYVSKGKLFLDG
jgi:hypothetical protein